MDREQQIAYINSQVACALAEIEAMKAANRQAPLGTYKYSEQDFRDVPERFGIYHNAVVGFFTGR